MANKFTDEDDALLEELGVEVETEKKSARSANEERIVAGFEEIQRFVEQKGLLPQHGEDREIFERLYAVRLDRLRDQADCRALLKPLDTQGILSSATVQTAIDPDTLDDDALLAELGVEDGDEDNITQLRHVRSAAEKRVAEEIANREKCEDFERFSPLFQQVQKELESGLRQTKEFERKSEIAPGRFYILGGQKAYVSVMEEAFTNEHGYTDARLRVIFDNGTESNLLMRSLQRALQKDSAGRRITDPIVGPLFAHLNEEGDLASGTIYVLRSASEHPIVAAHRDLIHKIGVTGGSVESRIATAPYDATYLLADVEVVATYKLFNINRVRLEKLIHRVFAGARLEITIQDRFGKPVQPQEWFLVPLSIIDEAVERVRDQTIVNYVYDPSIAALVVR